MSTEEETKRVSDFHDFLPFAYQIAYQHADGRPRPGIVGLIASDLLDYAQPDSGAYRIAMAKRFTVTIVDVKKVTLDFGQGQHGQKFEVSYTTAGKPDQVETIPTPLLSDRQLGYHAKRIWDKFDEQGRSLLIGKHMMLFKHNDPPKEGDRSQAGYRCCVYARALD